MLDPKVLRDNPEDIKENLSKRQDPKLMEYVDDYVNVDIEWRDLKKQSETLRKTKNEFSKSIRTMQGDDKQGAIKQMQGTNTDLDNVELHLKQAEEKRKWLLDRIPNLLHNTVPYGVDDTANQTLRTWGELPTFDFEPKDHHELLELLDIAELERARKTSGAGFYFLKNEGAILEYALLRYGMEVIMEKGISLLSTPTMVRKVMLYGTGFLPLGEEDIYKIEGKDLNLIGTSEVALGGMHQDEVFLENELPTRYAGISNCFRTEASATTKDDKGIFRVHEFKKVEMFTFTKPEDSWDEQERMLEIAEEIFKGLEMPYQIVNICTGDIGSVAARKYDIEVWMPGQKRYREVVSCSNCTDYQSRRLNIKYRAKEGSKPIGFVHTLNSTAITTTRPMVAILENYQQKDGTVLIPKVLQKYTGFKEMKPKKK
ncbi:MAG: Serine--tRNA ligase [Candidatus Heimdallarchaeota archaeon LC_2]|nr:MAG: Serine--tRNA ligase [Candidatus Heimdallarchaeota archaeon LC_2]